MKKLVIVSGGIGVIGQAIARLLTQDGYSVLALDFRAPEAGKPIVGEFFKCDITNEKDIEALGAYLTEQKAEIHGLVNNASCQPPGFVNQLEDYPLDTFKKVLETNIVGSFLLVKTVIPFMKAQKFGSIINIGSIQGVVAPTFEMYEGTNITSPLVYSVSKAGLIHFCKWVAAKYGKWNIRCNALSPGGLNDSQKGGSTFQVKYASKTPLGRMVTSAEVAEVIKFMISDKSSYMTGQNIVLDGGWTIY